MEEKIKKGLLELEDELSKLNTVSKQVVDAQKNILEKTTKIIESNIEFIEKINKIDFPSRLEKIDISVSGINQSNLNILMKLENMEKSIKEDSGRKFEKINENFKNQNKSIKYIKIGLFIIVIINIITIFIK